MNFRPSHPAAGAAVSARIAAGAAGAADVAGTAGMAGTALVDRPADPNPGRRSPGVPMRLVPASADDDRTHADPAVGLVRRAQRGDRAAFEGLVRGTARMLYARLYLETGDRDRADDLVQETYLTAWRSIGQLTDVPDAGAFRRWLLTVARTVRIDAGRRAGRRKRAGPRAAGASAAHDDLLAAAADPGPSPAEAVELSERREQVLGLLRALPEEQRAPVAMRYLAGADYATIADQLGLTNGSLRGLLNRGMARLRQMMGAWEE